MSKQMIILALRDEETVEVEATVIGTLGVHLEHDSERAYWKVSHVATGLGVISGLSDEQAALDAAALMLEDETATYCLRARTQEEATARMDEQGDWVGWSVFTLSIKSKVSAMAIERLKASGAILTPAKLIDLLELDPDELANLDHMDEVVEGIEEATDEVKDKLLSAVWETCSDGMLITDMAEGYSEPGYDDPERGVYFGDWNGKGGDELVKVIEACGAAIEWSDEWYNCGDCHKAVRTSADSYCWTQSYVLVDGCEIVCHECMEDDDAKREYIEQELEGEPTKADTLGWDLEDLGYVQMDENFQTGLYGGQCADPHKIAAALRERGISRFVFQIDSTGQFDLRFSCWIHEDETPEGGVTLAYSEANGSDPVVAMKAAMQDASAKMSALSGDGVKVATCNPDGTADVRMVSNEDFIAGKALDGER